MKPRRSKQTNQAITLMEVLTIVVVLMVIFLIVSQMIAADSAIKRYAQRVSCVNYVKSVGLAYRVWAGDHHDRYPMQESVTNGGLKEIVNSGKSASQLAFLTFMVMSNELATPKVLHCSSDDHTTAATDFDSSFADTNISYFANPDANQLFPRMILTGDDNLQIGDVPVNSGLLNLPANAAIAWTAERHFRAGNIGFADGSAQQVRNDGLQRALQQISTNTIRLAIP